jgi:hypothetical protein
MKEIFRVLNQMQADGIIGRYAIGGAVGATFYLEPVATLDVDVFITVRAEPGKLIISLTPIFDYLTARGCTLEGEYVRIGDWPVQFLPPTGQLIEDALATASEMDVDGTTTRVFSAEHLAAIALETGRAKDKARLLQFVEAGILDAARFEEIVNRHNLVERWQKFVQQFLRK